jgi:hypothetical protein
MADTDAIVVLASMWHTLNTVAWVWPTTAIAAWVTWTAISRAI